MKFLQITILVLATLATASLLDERLSAFAVAAVDAEDEYGGRVMLVHVPTRLAPPGSRALVVVLHGGLGNARSIWRRRPSSAG